MVKVLLFDFWGTLVEQGVHSPIKQVKNLLQINLPFPDYVVRMERAMMTRTFPGLQEAFQSVCAEFQIECPREIMEELVGMWNASWMLARPYPDVEKALAELKKKYTLVLISNTDSISVQKVLEKYNLRPYFDNVFFSFEMGLLKTDKDFLTQVVGQLNVGVEDCVMIGDSIQSDILPAKHLGMPTILMDRKGRREMDPSIRTLKELETMLA